MVDLDDGEWLEANRVQWDERVPLHATSPMYDRTALLAGSGRLAPIEEAELADVAPAGLDGLRVLHLQCHFGMDSLVLAQRGATVVGVDFSHAAIVEARALAAELSLTDRARFIEANVYDLRHILPEPESFDLVYVTWGTIVWLPDLPEWAKLIAWYLKPGGRLYFADNHPAASVFRVGEDGAPRFDEPYDTDGEPALVDEAADYAVDTPLQNSRTWQWSHPVAKIVQSLLDAGLTLEFLHEHYAVPWQMLDVLVPVGDGLWGWPDQHWLPLALSLSARA
jgi:SAM-dependent methyltransferase